MQRQITTLHKAAEDGQLDVIKTLLEQKANPNEKDMDGMPPLCWAVSKLPEGVLIIKYRNQLDIIKTLIDHNADPNATDKFGRTPLVWSISLTVVWSLIFQQSWSFALYKDIQLEAVKTLLDKKADPNIKDRDNRTVLHDAASDGGQPEIVKLLLAHKADLNAKQDVTYWTPLYEAAYQGKLEIVKILLEQKAQPNVKDKYGKTPLNYAESNGHKEIIEILRGIDTTPEVILSEVDRQEQSQHQTSSQTLTQPSASILSHSMARSGILCHSAGPISLKNKETENEELNPMKDSLHKVNGY